MIRYSIIFEGRVQGVGFRYFARKSAQSCHVTGFVRNLSDGTVHLEVQGPEDRIAVFLKIIREGNGYSSVSRFEMKRIDLYPEEKEFSIRY